MQEIAIKIERIRAINRSRLQQTKIIFEPGEKASKQQMETQRQPLTPPTSESSLT